MPINVAICDDNSIDIEVLQAALLAYNPYLIISTYTNGTVLLDDLIDNTKQFDLIFLDIFMPKINGLDVAMKIYTSLKNSAKIIFVSSSDKFYSQAFDVFAFNYILKPIKIIRLTEVLDKAIIDISIDRRRQINIFSKGSNHRIYLRDILYIESDNKKVIYHLVDGNSLDTYGKLGDVYALIMEKDFLRCHQSYIVNMFHISELAKDYFYIGDKIIKISKKYLKISKEKYLKYINHK